MRKYFFIFTLYMVLFEIHSQSYINYAIGKYLCTRTIMNGATVVSTCTCILELYPDATYTQCVSYQDSCYGATYWDYTSIDIIVKPDSSFTGYPTAATANGKIYTNDSIHLDVYYPLTMTLIYRKIFDGHRLHSGVGIKEMSLNENVLLVSPQPAQNEFYLQSTQINFNSHDPPEIYDLAEKKVELNIYYINNSTYKIDVSTLPSGIYFLRIETSKGILNKKIVIER